MLCFRNKLPMRCCFLETDFPCHVPQVDRHIMQIVLRYMSRGAQTAWPLCGKTPASIAGSGARQIHGLCEHPNGTHPTLGTKRKRKMVWGKAAAQRSQRHLHHLSWGVPMAVLVVLIPVGQPVV